MLYNTYIRYKVCIRFIIRVIEERYHGHEDTTTHAYGHACGCVCTSSVPVHLTPTPNP